MGKSFPFYKVSKKVFEKGDGEHYGIYVAAYENECVCKIGITSTPRERLAAISGYSWTNVRFSSFYFPYRHSSTFVGLPDDYSILRVSAFAFEKICHDKLKELGAHLRMEFFELFPEEADLAIRKIAKENDFHLATPQDIMGAEFDPSDRNGDRLAFFELANAACLADEVIKKGHLVS